jgi:hypothetical protein
MVKWKMLRMFLKVFEVILLSTALILFCYNIFRIINGMIETRRLAEWRGDPFQTEPWYRRKYGIKTINLSPAVEEYLHLMIKKVVEAGSSYYLKADDKEIEKVRGLFLEEEFKELKRKINEARGKENSSLIMEVEDCGILTQSLEMKFSKPRKYKLLENRLGIMVYIPFKAFNFLKGGCWDHHSFLFFFKQDGNKEWKIERIELLGIFKLPAPRLLEMEEEAAILRIKKGIRI